MDQEAVLVSRSGSITTGLAAIVSDRFDTVETIVTDHPEDGTYHIPPHIVDRVERQFAHTERPVLVVDGLAHPGQVVDLTVRLPSVTVWDRRSLVWKHLSEDNPVAATQLAVWQCRIDCRRVAAAARDGGPDTPSGTSGHQSEAEHRLNELRSRLDKEQARARRQIATSYADVDGHVVLLGRPRAGTSSVWEALTGEQADTTAVRPARPATATATVGPQTVALTDTPGIPGDDGIPEWFAAAVPGVVTAINQADLVITVGHRPQPLLEAVDDRSDGVCRSVAEPNPGAVRSAIDDCLDRRSYQLRLPYGDQTHALVASLHDEAIVHDVVYDDTVRLDVTLSASAAAEVLRQVAVVDGTVVSSDT